MEIKEVDAPCLEHRLTHSDCRKRIAAVHDTMDVLNGKWKIAILSVLGFGKRRFSEILKEVEGISGKMLSRELKDMEMNLLIKRKIVSEQPIAVEYTMTDYCVDLLPIIDSLAAWGTRHRQVIVEQYKEEKLEIAAD